jgi:hypothetical protein
MKTKHIDWYLWIGNRAVGYDYKKKSDCTYDGNTCKTTYHPDYATAVKVAKGQDI